MKNLNACMTVENCIKYIIKPILKFNIPEKHHNTLPYFK